MTAVQKKTFGLVFIILSGCSMNSAIDSESRPIFDEVIVKNKTDTSVYDVKLKDEVTNKYFQCSVILPDSQCSIGFTARKAKGHGATIFWRTKTEEHIAPVQADVVPDAGFVGKVYIDLLPLGESFTYLQ